ncbi:MAG: hypothetical protein BM564_13520 [Bacteroidetes bacterium MedPE-SWsnd-G2]|nr:MAG: hypothetical protein BM564_13520 [Bacteroidetes bacterium MedPE-SWsnd-G2]
MKSDVKNTRQKDLFSEAFQMVKTPIVIAIFITPIRYILELFGIPEHYIFIIGLLWFTLGLSVYLGIKHHQNNRYLVLLLLGLIIFSPISRFPVAIAWLVDTHWQIGTHYSLYFDNFGQALLNHLVYGSLLQIVPGFLIGSITFTIMRHKQKLKLKRNTINNG